MRKFKNKLEEMRFEETRDRLYFDLEQIGYASNKIDGELLHDIVTILIRDTFYNKGYNQALIEVSKYGEKTVMQEHGLMAENRPDGISDIILERARQITVEGYTTEHDDTHTDESIAQAASIYAMPTDKRDMWNKIPNNWPWENEFWKPTPKDRIKELTKAGALIVAEIERLKRLEAKN